MIYDGTLIESVLYDQAVITGREANGDDIHALWKSLDEFESGEAMLHPPGLLNLLRTQIR